MNKIKSFVLNIGLIGSLSVAFSTAISCGNKPTGKNSGPGPTKGDAFHNESMPLYKDVGSLKSDDKWWNLSSNDTYSGSVERGIGDLYYENLKLENNSWPQNTLNNWLNIYDTSFDNIMNDKNHKYAKTSPNKYNASLSGFLKIYNSDPLDKSAQIKTGNNNNGLNGIYSGIAFGIRESSGSVKKIFNKSIIETVNQKPFITSSMISNGWEHVSPASKEGVVFEGHRKKVNDAKYPAKFGKSIGDLHNLRPSIQDVFNSPRSNNPYGIVPGNNTKAGVDFELGLSTFGLKVAEPRVNVRGDIARILFYMHDRYHVKYDKNYYKLMILWAAMDPVTKEEIGLDSKIKTIMGFSNDYVTGKKKIPYDQEIEAKILAANKDDTKNSFTWGPAAKKIVANKVDSLDKAKNLDWSESNEITYGNSIKVSKYLDALAKSQLIIRMKINNVLYYRRVSVIQSKALIVKDWSSEEKSIKININSSMPSYLATKLNGNSRTSYKDMTDEITELKYLIIK